MTHCINGARPIPPMTGIAPPYCHPPATVVWYHSLQTVYTRPTAVKATVGGNHDVLAIQRRLPQTNPTM
jgi:hypothetical protein